MALIDAVKQQDLEKVKKISLQINEKRRNRILGLAAKFGALNIVKYFSKGKKKDCRACKPGIIEIDEDQIRAKNHICCEIPVIFAAANGHYEIVKYLNDKGADVRSYDDLAFRCAAKGGHLEVVQYLVKLGADIYAGDKNCALQKAAEYGHYKVVKYLYEIGGFYVREGFGEERLSSALNLACINGDMQTVNYLRFEAKATLEDDAVLNAAKNGHLQLVKELINDGANVRRYDDHALHWACGNGHFEMVKYLIEEVGAANKSDKHFPVEQAAQYGHLEILKYLCENKMANFKCNNNYPVRTAAWSGHLEVVKYLHGKGADIRSRNNYALRYSIENGHLPVLKYLIQAGVEINDDCFRWATYNNHLHIVKYLCEVSPTHMIKVINDLLVSASNSGYFKLIKYFMEHGADTSKIESPYLLFYMKMQKKNRERAQKKIYFWWIPICYDVNRETGKRMMIKNLEKAKELGMELN